MCAVNTLIVYEVIIPQFAIMKYYHRGSTILYLKFVQYHKHLSWRTFDKSLLVEDDGLHKFIRLTLTLLQVVTLLHFLEGRYMQRHKTTVQQMGEMSSAD